MQANCAAIPVHWDQEAQNHFRCRVNGSCCNGEMRTDRMSPWGSQEVYGMKRLLKPKPELHTHTHWNTHMQPHIRKSDTAGWVCFLFVFLKDVWIGIPWHNCHTIPKNVGNEWKWKLIKRKRTIFLQYMHGRLITGWNEPKTITDKYKSHNLNILNIVPPSAYFQNL